MKKLAFRSAANGGMEEGGPRDNVKKQKRTPFFYINKIIGEKLEDRGEMKKANI